MSTAAQPAARSPQPARRRAFSLLALGSLTLAFPEVPRAQVNPSASAFLTRTNSMAEWSPVLAADRPVIAFWGGLSLRPPLPGHWEPYLMDLRESCSTQMRRRIDQVDQDWVVGYFPEENFHVSVSAKGRRAAYATLVSSDTYYGYWDIWLQDRDAAPSLRRVVSGVQLPHSLALFGQGMSHSISGAVSPLPALSEDGRYLVWLEASTARDANHVMRLDLDTSGASPIPWDCPDAYIGQLATTSSVLSGDAALIAGRTAIAPFGLPITSDTIWRLRLVPPPLIHCCAPLDPSHVDYETCKPYLPFKIAQLTSSPPAVDMQATDTKDVTMSSDGRVVAWASHRDFCTGASNEHQDVWLWLEDGGPAPPGIQSCEDADAERSGGRIYRVTTGGVSEGFPTIQARPFLSRDGRRLFFIGSREFESFTNLNRVPQLWVVSVTDGSGLPTTDWSIKAVTRNLNPDEHVVMASTDREGVQVVYARARNVGEEAELRMVRVDYQGNAQTPDMARPAHAPFQLEGLQCSANETGGETILSMSGYLRQFRNAASPSMRAVVLLQEATFESGGAIGRAPAVIQQVGDGQRAVFEAILSVAGTGHGQPTCHVRGLDGSGVQADVVDLKFQVP